MAKSSQQNVGDVVCLESQKDLAIVTQNDCVKFVAHKELNEAHWDTPLLSTLLKA